jgi:hypothetical protein
MAEVSAAKARMIIRKTMAKGDEMGFKPLAVVVMARPRDVSRLRMVRLMGLSCWVWRVRRKWRVPNSRPISWRP